MEPVLAESGRSALDVLEETKHGRQPFSLVLLDAQMPDMDGFAVAEPSGMTRTSRDRCSSC